MPLKFNRKKPKLERRNSILSVATTQDANIDEIVNLAADSQHVGMHEQARSHGKPILSSSYTNCLCVVVHDAEKQQGRLLHILPARSTEFNQERLFRYVDSQIKQLIDSFPAGTPVDVLLWKGASLFPNESNKLTESYADHLKKNVSEHVTVIDRMDRERVAGEASILYCPKTGEIFIVAGEHENKIAPVACEMKNLRASKEKSILSAASSRDRQPANRSLLFSRDDSSTDTSEVPEYENTRRRFR